MAASMDVNASWSNLEANANGGTPPDIKRIVDHYRRIGILHSIVPKALRIVQDLVLWRNKLFSVLSMLLVCLMCVLPELFLMVLLQACVTAMLLGRWYSRIALKREEMADGSHGNAVEADMAEFVGIMRQVQVLMAKGSHVVEELKDIASWTRPAFSLCVTLYFCLQAGVLVLLGMRWFLALLPFAVYCSNNGFRQAVLSIIRRPQAIEDKQESTTSAPTASQGAEDSVNPSTDASADPPSDPTPNQNPAVHHSRSNNYSLLQQRSRARGRGRNQPGNCTYCRASFAKLLKRKHSCNSCGLDFCGNCTVKVKKFLLGATSPAAYEDSVRVCVACSLQLKAMDSELSSFTSQQRSTTAPGPTPNPASQQTRTDTHRSSANTEQAISEDTAQCQACLLHPIQQSCSCCGRDFCRNCTVEVKKFLLGVTSPAGYEDSVRVCVACSVQLKAMDSELSSFTSQQRSTTAPGPTANPTSQQTRTDTHTISTRAELPSADTVHS